MKIETPKLSQKLPQLQSPNIAEAAGLENAEVTGLIWASLEAKRPSFDSVRFLSPDLTSTILRNGGWADVQIDGGTMAGANLTGSTLRRVQISKTRASGLVISETEGRDIEVTDSKLDLANFRFAKWNRVKFTRCTFSEADFAGARMSDVVFDGCDLTSCDFSGAVLVRVDLRGSLALNLRGISGLKGAIMTHDQLISLVPELAQELGIKIIQG